MAHHPFRQLVKSKSYELIEHTADIGVKIKGRNLKELFKNAAAAMFDIIAERKAPSISEGRQRHKGTKAQVKKYIIRQKADNREELFINWLNELLSLSAAKELIFSDFKLDKLEKNNLMAAINGRDMGNYRINSEIKAATYHELKLEKTKSGWQAEVIFDV